jgi:hypothetical protein
VTAPTCQVASSCAMCRDLASFHNLHKKRSTAGHTFAAHTLLTPAAELQLCLTLLAYLPSTQLRPPQKNSCNHGRLVFHNSGTSFGYLGVHPGPGAGCCCCQCYCQVTQEQYHHPLTVSPAVVMSVVQMERMMRGRKGRLCSTSVTLTICSSSEQTRQQTAVAALWVQWLSRRVHCALAVGPLPERPQHAIVHLVSHWHVLDLPIDIAQ